MTAQEGFANNYLIFRAPTNYILVLVPFTIGVLVNIFVNNNQSIDSYSDELIAIKQQEAIDAYFDALNITFIILLSFIICYRWTSMQNDGSYGFWITQGVNKTKFFVATVIKFILYLYLSEILGLGIIFYLNNYYLNPINLIGMNLLILTHLMFVVGLGVFLANIISNPELSSLTFILLLGMNFAFVRNQNSIWFKLFHSDLQYKMSDAFLSLIIAIFFGLTLNLISLRIHVVSDVDM